MFRVKNLNYGFPMKLISTSILFIIVLWFAPSVHAQAVSRGFDRTIPATALNAEVVRQPSLQVMEVQIKPMRMVWVDLPDPDTGKLKQTEVWYLVWRAINRPIRKRQGDDTQAVNSLDPLPGPLMFMPAFTLVTYDDPETEIPKQILPDRIVPQAMGEIERVERIELNNSVSVIQEFPAPTAPDEEQQAWIYGVATWTNVDKETDFFKVILKGFSNGYENRGTIEAPELWRKVVVQRFVRPGDAFDPNIKEFDFRGGPEWTFQPDRDLPAQ